MIILIMNLSGDGSQRVPEELFTEEATIAESFGLQTVIFDSSASFQSSGAYPVLMMLW